MNDADIPRAVQALDLSGIGPLERVDRGPQLAFKLWAILNREAYIETDALPDAADAPPLVLPITAGDRKIGRVTVAKGPDGAYRFTPGTLDDLDELWRAVRGKPVVAGLPDPDLRQMDPAAWMEGRMSPDGRQRLLGVAAWRWISLALLLVFGTVGYLAIRGLTLLVARHLLRLENSSHEYRDLMQGGLGIALAAIGAFVARDAPMLEQRGEWAGLFGFLARMTVVFGLTLLTFAAWDAALRAYVRRAGEHAHPPKRLLAPVVLRLGRALIVILALLGVCEALGFRPSSILATLGIGGLAVAFAAKDSIENVFGSIVVLVENPFAIGDWVKVGEVSGKVEDIRLRSTRIRTFDDSVVIFPNSALLSKSVENFGMRRYRRFRTTVGIAVGTQAGTITEFIARIRAVLREDEHVSDERRRVHLDDLGASSYAILIDCFLIAADTDTELELRERLLTTIVRVAEELHVALTPHAPCPDPSS